MEFNEFIGKLEDVFDDTDLSTLSMETQFRTLDEWSSLSALSFIAMADEECGVEIKGDEIKKAETLEDLFNLLNSKL